MSIDRPEELTSTGVQTFAVQRCERGHPEWVDEPLAVEKPLFFVINGRPLLATMRTPGDDRDLVAGYLVTEGLAQRPEQISILKTLPGEQTDTICVGLRDIAPEALDKLRRVGASVSSCGVCGRQGAEAFTPRASGTLRPLELPLEAIPDLFGQLRDAQPLFRATGGIHAAGLIGAGPRLLCVKEDIGRHNAIDKVAGWMLREGLLGGPPLALLSSGRASYEVVQKAAMAGIGTVVSVSAASSMAVEVARALGMRLIGFVRRDKAIVYC